MITGTTKVIGIIGYPVKHTMSPFIHNYIDDILCEGDSESVYVPFEVEKGHVKEAIAGAFALGITGMNVTVPHKREVMEGLTDIDPLAEKIGAVNTIVRGEKGYKGYNTDAEGFLSELDFYNVNIEGKTVVILGAGGASRAVAFSVAQRNPSKVYILNRSLDKAQELADAVNASLDNKVFCAGEISKASEIQEDGLIAIQCTSVGLAPKVDECVVLEKTFFEKVSCGVDLVYKPSVTKFMKLCRESGAEAYNGLRMLLYQGVRANERFLDRTLSKSDIERTARNLERYVGIKRPIILIGYMGSGKSTIGKVLAARKNEKFLDTDDRIVVENNRSINDIFASEGEEYFRDLETGLISNLIEENFSGIISTGGGLVLREENRKLLKSLGTIVYLRATEDTLYRRLSGSSNRPLLKDGELKEKIHTMLEIRNPIYEAAADVCIDTDDLSVDMVVDRLSKELYGK